MIKSYTDITQSKKLAEFLPFESADMCHKCIGEDPYDVCLRPYSEWREEYKGLLVAKEVDVIPCWSLAALLDIIRKTIGGYSMDCASKNIVMSVELGDKPWKLETDTYSNEIDNCYDMILKLYEEGLIMAT